MTANISADGEEEVRNVEGVMRAMHQLVTIPTVKLAAVMPDACPTGALSVPVGGVLATENAIHPGWHSADICCSMAITVFHDDVNPKDVLDAGMAVTHFGVGGRKRGEQIRPADDLLARFEANQYLKHVLSDAIEHHATQGDGNHFFFVGRVKSTGRVAIVTHHGSWRPGAMLHKMGMTKAEKTRKELCPDAPREAAWIVADSEDGQDYWWALQLVREWTKSNHFAIHRLVEKRMGLKVEEQFWNEHNFVFQRSDGLFYHAKGATPAYQGYASDETGVTLIPMNMAQPILIARGSNAPNGLGFAPHGAGRNLSRSGFRKKKEGEGISISQLVKEQTAGIDARFYCGIPDPSELPGAYKDAATVIRQIKEYGLAEIVDTVEPYGCVMCGSVDKPWKRKKRGEQGKSD